MLNQTNTETILILLMVAYSMLGTTKLSGKILGKGWEHYELINTLRGIGYLLMSLIILLIIIGTELKHH